MDRLSEILYKKMFFQGMLSNITNSKIAIFSLSYLPQFVVMDGTKTTLQLFMDRRKTKFFEPHIQS